MISASDLEKLIQAFKDGSMGSEDRRDAAEILGKIKDSRALDPLIQYFKDPAKYNPSQHSLVRTFEELQQNRSAAEEALVKIGEPAIQPLIQIIDDDDYKLSDPARALNDNVSLIRRSAVRALGRIKGPQVITSDPGP
jgi:HEAT repeat protein